ncbi:hypothetical protein C161_27408 [Paenibacillus sp. FSL R5-192]|nr:hypothetical protein C161_27408 [Paenibacillus sp. FSL R5-192]
MPVIHKYVVQPSDQVQHVTVSHGSKIVSCGYQEGQLASMRNKPIQRVGNTMYRRDNNEQTNRVTVRGI